MKDGSVYLTARSAMTRSGCIEWTGSRTRGGYGTMNFGGLKTTAHRFAYMLRHGAIPDGYEIDHLCKNTLCVNPDHLDAVTHLENVRRSDVAGATHCKHGHEFTESNTYMKANGCRSCRTCNAERQRTARVKFPERYRSYDIKRRKP